MLKIVLLLAGVAYVLGATIPDGLLPHSKGRIVGGADATIAAFPYQISLQRAGSHYCGGSIYSQRIIITAAHCLYAATAKQLRIRAGSTEWSSGGVEVGVASFMKHDNYNSNNVDNDIALLKLEMPLSFSSTIRPISLATVAPPTGAAAVVTGWGKTAYESTENAKVLQYVNLKIIDTKQCASSKYGYGNKILSSMICATAPGRSSCNEDSGGPLVSGGAQVGVVSWGEKCALANYPGVYANVAVLKQWIEKTASYLA